MDRFLVISQEMRALGLQGNDLLVYATINGFSQDGKGCYWGKLDDLAKVCGIARRTAAYCLKRLCEGGFIVKEESITNGVRHTSYTIKTDTLGGSANLAPVQNLREGSAKSAPNNKSNNKVGDINISSLSYKKGGFVKPSLFEVQQYIAQRGSAVDAEAFYAYYESNGWKVGRNPMRDWKQAIVTWERREAQHPTPTPPRKESWAERQRRNLEKISAMYAGVGDVQ